MLKYATRPFYAYAAGEGKGEGERTVAGHIANALNKKFSFLKVLLV